MPLQIPQNETCRKSWHKSSTTQLLQHTVQGMHTLHAHYQQMSEGLKWHAFKVLWVSQNKIPEKRRKRKSKDKTFQWNLSIQKRMTQLKAPQICSICSSCFPPTLSEFSQLQKLKLFPSPFDKFLQEHCGGQGRIFLEWILAAQNA